ncbi:MAG: SprB repeat-containing protein, partial [Chitinophagales bacterium]|nr:SprB repeat-containing protein [Chitinophagales bacterium]
MDRFIFYKTSFFVLLFVSLPFTIYTQNECDPDDDDTPVGSLSYNGPVCAGTPIILTFILISDEDDNEYDVTYSIGGQQFQLDDISDGHQETHVLNNSTNAILEVIYNEDDDCVVNSNFVLPITIWSNPTVNTFTSPASCGSSNGSITLSASEGTPPYTYQLVGGGSQTSPTFNNLEAGNYNFIVTDANNCSAFTSATVIDQGAPMLSVNSTSPASCGSSNGSITLSANEGTPPYTYQLVRGSSQTRPTFNNLEAGNYDF